MSVKIDTSGLDALQKRLKKLSNTKSIPFEEMFSPSFMRSNTRFSNIENMFEASGYKVETEEDFEQIPDKEWNEFISSETKFKSWDDMIHAAGGEYVAKQLGLS
tara:strand:+ start:63 stop:374 length:312 start_codon:yes stop_codon:yes gene_type:complete